MIDKNKLKQLLRNFNTKGYANTNVKYLDNGKNGKILTLKIYNYTYEDEFYGGEPYSGNETIWENGKEIFRCVYWGKFVRGIDLTEIYKFLQRALAKGPDNDLVHRGPKEYLEGNLKYINSIEGDIEEFKQTERIFINNKEIYIAYFIGGRISI